MIICPSFSVLVWEVGLFSMYFFLRVAASVTVVQVLKAREGLSHFFCRFNSVVHLAGDKIRRFTEVERNLFSHLFLYPNNKINFYHFSFVSNPSCLVPLTSSFPTVRSAEFPELAEPASSSTEPISVVRARKSALQTSQVGSNVQPGLAANCSKSPLIISCKPPNGVCSLCCVLNVTILRFIQ